MIVPVRWETDLPPELGGGRAEVVTAAAHEEALDEARAKVARGSDPGVEIIDVVLAEVRRAHLGDRVIARIAVTPDAPRGRLSEVTELRMHPDDWAHAEAAARAASAMDTPVESLWGVPVENRTPQERPNDGGDKLSDTEKPLQPCGIPGCHAAGDHLITRERSLSTPVPSGPIVSPDATDEGTDEADPDRPSAPETPQEDPVLAPLGRAHHALELTLAAARDLDEGTPVVDASRVDLVYIGEAIALARREIEWLRGRPVAGQCPMGCGTTLFLGEGGHVTCSFVECSNPGAADELLERDPNRLLQRRTPGEREAYLQGWKAGADLALTRVERGTPVPDVRRQLGEIARGATQAEAQGSEPRSAEGTS